MRVLLVLAALALPLNADSVTPPIAEAVARQTTATWKIDGEVHKFTRRSLADGEDVVCRFLGSCSDGPEALSESTHTRIDLLLAREGEHFRIVFGRPRPVEVMRLRLQVDEIVFANGAVWVRQGNWVGRYAKYQFKESERFRLWLRVAEKYSSR